jgi:hypothetical protein
MHQPGVAEDSCGSRSFGLNRKVREQDALSFWECTGDKMQARKRNDGISEAAEAINQYPANWRIRLQVRLPR